MRNPPGMHDMRGRIAIDGSGVGCAAQQAVQQNDGTVKHEMVCRSIHSDRPEIVYLCFSLFKFAAPMTFVWRRLTLQWLAASSAWAVAHRK